MARHDPTRHDALRSRYAAPRWDSFPRAASGGRREHRVPVEREVRGRGPGARLGVPAGQREVRDRLPGVRRLAHDQHRLGAVPGLRGRDQPPRKRARHADRGRVGPELAPAHRSLCNVQRQGLPARHERRADNARGTRRSCRSDDQIVREIRVAVFPLTALATPAFAQTVRIDATPGHAINVFDPDNALGSSIDVLSRTDINKVYTPHIVQEALSAGWGPITYRVNTELRMAAWHWTENGTWSDAAHRSGYFTGSTDLKEPIRYILAYALPHRGFATSGDRPIQGPNLTYWKSNPYLTSKFTGESDALHPQWVIVDLQAEKPVSFVRIAWMNPYATTYQVEYWTGADALDFDEGPKGDWKVFSSGVLKNASGGTVNLKLSDVPVSTRFLRILMTQSSNTCDEHGADDVRNCVGYAIQQIAT